jgi:hypothetical protein
VKIRGSSAARSLERRGLPWRMYQHGMAYRFHHPDGRKINLGRDLSAALRNYYALLAVRPGDPDAKELQPPFMLARHRKGAKQRGLEFKLTSEHIADLLDVQGYCCAITGAAFRSDKVDGIRIRPWLPSIDRIDSTKGYVDGNVRIVCGFVNIAMKAFGERLFVAVIKGIVEAEVRARLQAEKMERIPTTGPGGIEVGIKH